MKIARQNVITFRDFALPFNPAELKIENERRLQRFFLPLRGEAVRDLGAGAQKISGKGTFSGESAEENYIKLQTEYSRAGEGVLLLPGFCPVKAVFSSLAARAYGKDVMYEFVFVQTGADEPTFENNGFYVLGQGESLWDVSAKLKIPLGELMRCNLQYDSPFAPMPGERVKLP